NVAHETTNPLDQRAVAGSFAALVRLPRHSPLVFPPHAVGVKETAVLTGRTQPADRRLSEVMDEHIVRADDAVSLLPHANRVIGVFEEADLEPLVEWTDSVPHLAADRRAEHRRRTDVEAAPGVGCRAAAREASQLAEGPVPCCDFGLVTGP